MLRVISVEYYKVWGYNIGRIRTHATAWEADSKPTELS